MFGKPRFDWLADHADDATLFQQAMVALGAGDNEAVVEAYDFAPFTDVVDVGGGHGQLLAAILSRHPRLRGVLFDLPAGIAAARATIGPPSRTEFIAGSFFDSVPGGAGAYLLKRVIHDWSDDQATTILRRCREAMLPGGRVLVLETIIPPGDAPDTIKLIDANMLVVTGGLERTEAQYAALFAGAGLQLRRIIPTRRPISILEAGSASRVQ